MACLGRSMACLACSSVWRREIWGWGPAPSPAFDKRHVLYRTAVCMYGRMLPLAATRVTAPHALPISNTSLVYTSSTASSRHWSAIPHFRFPRTCMYVVQYIPTTRGWAPAPAQCACARQPQPRPLHALLPFEHTVCTTCTCIIPQAVPIVLCWDCTRTHCAHRQCCTYVSCMYILYALARHSSAANAPWLYVCSP